MDDDPVAGLLRNYHELNAAVADEVSSLPTPLEFMRHVARNRPLIIRQGAADWTAARKWDAEYLRTVMAGSQVKVAVTPLGNADAVVEDPSGVLTFVEPHEIEEDFTALLHYVRYDTALPSKGYYSQNVKYAQTQNDNLRDEYRALFADVPSTIAFASEAFQQDPDAINFWLGNSRSTTALHKDNYENIYVQIRGKKSFTLLPPIEMACVNETPLPRARYRPHSEQDPTLVVDVVENADPVPVPVWDPDDPTLRPSPYSELSKPLWVTLNEGDMMYLPAMWYHKVGQSSGKEGFACSVNYWYDMDFGGSFWSSNAFIRDVVIAKDKEVHYGDLDEHE